MKYLFVSIIFLSSIYAQIITPVSTIKASGSVIDMVISDENLVTGTSNGSLEVYDIRTQKLLSKIQFPNITDFMGDEIAPKLFAVDYDKKSNSFLAVVQTSSGFREVHIIKDGKKEILISAKDKLFISKAKFVDENRVIIALLSNEYILMDIAQKKRIYRLHVSYSHFSDFMLSEDRTLLAGSSESGKITILHVDDGKVVKTLSGGNVDNVYKVDMKKDKVLCAGQDRRGIVYDKDMETFDRFDAHFLIYSGALSPSAKLAAFAFTEDNDIVVFDLSMKSKLYTLKGQKSTLNVIVFKNEKELISSSDDKFINIWRLK